METYCFQTLRDLLSGFCRPLAVNYIADGIRTEVKSPFDGRRYEVILRPIDDDPEYQNFLKILE
jgi:hypothetical protein